MRLLIVFAVLIVGVVGVALFYQSDAFAITTVRVTGAQRLTNNHLEQLAAVPAGSTLLRVDIEGIRQRLADDPWVAEVSVVREYPSTLVIEIKERTPFAIVETYIDLVSNDVVPWLISSDGVWLGNTDGSSSDVIITDEEIMACHLINGVQHNVQPSLGKKCVDVGVINALTILAGLSPEMCSLIKNIEAPDRNQTTLTLRNNVIVAFGAAEDIEAKETAIKTCLNEYPDTLISINVRVADRVTVSFL